MFAAFVLTTSPTSLFAQSSSSLGDTNRSFDETYSHRKKHKLRLEPPPTLDAERDWASTGTDFNTGANWVGGIAPGLSDVAWFKTGETVQPNLSASLSIAGLYFSSTASSGYTLTNTNSATLTLTGYATDTSGAENSDATAVAIGAKNTSGINTISAPIILAPTSGSTSTFFQASGGTLTLSGAISGSGVGLTTSGVIVLKGANTYTGPTIVNGVLNIQNGAALGSTINGTTVNGTLQLQGGITVGAEALTMNGGALDNVSGTNNYGGLLTLTSLFATISSEGTLNLTNTGTITGPGTGAFLELTGSGGGSISSVLGFVSDSDSVGLELFRTGTWILSGANTFTGGIAIAAGVLKLSGSGTLGNITNGLVFDQGIAGTLDLNGTSQSIGDLETAQNTGAFIVNNGGGAVTLTVGNGNSGIAAGSFAGVIADNNNSTSGTIALTKTGTGIITLSGSNTYTGATTINGGTLQLGDGGTSGSLSPSSAIIDNANLTIDRSNTVTQGTNFSGSAITGMGSLTQAGSGTTLLTAANTYSGGTIVNSGILQLSGAGTLGSTSGALTFSGGTLDLNGTSQGVGNLTGSGSTILNNGGGAVTLTVGNGNAGGGSYAGAIADHTSGTGTVALTKTGTGTITLSGANTYSGATTVNGGKLIVNGSLGGTAVGVSSGTSLGGTGTIGTTGGGSVTVVSGGAIDLVDGSAATLTIQSAAGTNALTLAGGSILNFEIGAAGNPGTSDKIALLNGTSLLVSGGVTLNITGLSGFGTGTYNLITFASATGLNNFSLGTTPSGGAYSFVLGSNSTNEFLTVSLAASTATAFWKGDQSATWNTINPGGFTNWYTDATGTTNIALPGSNTDVTFATTNAIVANLNTTLGADFSIKGLTILGTSPTNTNSVTIGGANTLTLGIDGLTVSSGAAAVTLSTKVALSASQTWTNNSTNALTVSGIVSETGGAQALTKVGTGTLILSGANTYSGGTTLSAGTLKVGSTTALGTGALTISGGTKLDSTVANLVNANNNAQTWNGDFTFAGTNSLNLGTGVVSLGTTAGTSRTLTVSANTLTIGGAISNGTTANSLIKTGVGTLALSGANTYTGATTINGGILNIQNATALGTTAGGTAVNDNARLQIQGGITVGAEALSLSGVFGILENVNGTNNYGGLLTLGTANGGFFPSYSFITSDAGTLNLTNAGTITGTGSALYFQGAGSGSISSVLGMTSSYLIKDGTGTWTLSGANTYNVSGNSTTNIGTSIYDGTLKLSGAGTLGNKSNSLYMDGFSAISGSGSPVLDLNGTSQNVGNLDGGELGSGGTILNNGGGAVTFTIGNGDGGGGNYSGVIADHTSGTGTVALTKAGLGKITLSGANTYSGATAISGGVLNIQNATALGTVTGGTTVSSGATLQIQNNITVGSEALTISGAGASGATGALENVSETNNYGGLVKLAAASTISSDAGTLNLTNVGTITGATFGLTLTGNGNGNISSVIGTTTGTVTMNGGGTWTLLGANTYTGATTINSGILNIQNATALGTIAGGTTVGSGATLQIQGGITVGAEALTLGNIYGTLENVSGTNNYGGLVTLGAGPGGYSIVTSDSGTLNLTNTGTITGPGSVLDLAGAGNGTIASILGMTSGSLQMDGTGTWTLSGANTYTEAAFSFGTSIDSGTLRLSGSGTLGSTSNDLYIGAGTLDLNATSQGVGLLDGYGTIVNNGGGAVTLTIGNGNADGGNYFGVIADNNNSTVGTIALTKTGTGTMTLSGANTYSGVTTISGGILNVQNATALGTTTGGTTVSSGATLQLQGGITVGAEALTIKGIGASGATGALESVDGNNYGGLVALGAASTISSDAGTLNLTNTGAITGATFGLTLTGGGSGSIASIIGTTSGALIMNSSGTWILSGANTYTGGTTVSSGTLQLSGAGTLGGTSGALTVNNSTLDLNATSQGVGNFTGSGSTIVNNGGSAVTLTIGNGNGGGGNYAGVIADNNNSTAGTIALTKTGTGTITLSGANTYTGATTIGNGILNIQNATALGAATAGTTVSSGATLQIQNNISVGAEALTISGVGETTATGALENVSGTNTYGGLLTLGAATTISSDAGALSLTNLGTITGATFALTLTGAGNGSISGIIGTTSGTIIKTGTGTWTLSGANTYTGTVSVSNGILNIQNATALGTVAAGTTVTSGATLQIQGGITVGAEALTVSGVGETTATGALENVNGTNNYGGLLKLGAASTISSDAGTLNLTNTGTITGSTFGLTLTGAGDGSISSIIGTGTGTLTKTGTGTWTLSGANTYTGAVLVSAGILNIQNATALGTTAGAATVSSGAALQIQGSITVGAQALTISGTGASGATGALENVSGTNNYGGLLKLGAASTISSDAGTLNLTNAGTITGSAFGLTLTGAGDGSISSIIGTGTGTLTKTGTGTWTLSGANTYTGATTISAGILNIQNPTALGTTVGDTTVSNGATLQIQNNITVGVAEALTISGTGASGATGALENVSGTNNYGGLLTLSAASTISSDAGTLNLTNAGTITGATFGLTLTGAGNGNISSIIGTTSGTLTKTGGGAWTLSAANTYTGATAINGGTLNLAVAGALGATSGVTVNNGGTLLLSGSNAVTDRINNGAPMALNGGTFNTGGLAEHGATNNTAGLGALTLQSTSIIDMGAGTSIIAFANSNSAPWSGTLDIYNWSGTPLTGGGIDELFFGNNATGLSPTQLAEVQFFSGAGTGAYGAGAIILANGELVPIPEPGTWFVAALTFGGVFFMKTRRRKL